MRGAVTLTLQVAVSVALLALLARQVAWAEIAAVMGRLRNVQRARLHRRW